MALTQVTNELIAAGGVHTNNIADDAITHTKVGSEFTSSHSLTAAATIDVNFNEAQVFSLTPDQNTTLNIINPVVGISKVIVITFCACAKKFNEKKTNMKRTCFILKFN